MDCSGRVADGLESVGFRRRLHLEDVLEVANSETASGSPWSMLGDYAKRLADEFAERGEVAWDGDVGVFGAFVFEDDVAAVVGVAE